MSGRQLCVKVKMGKKTVFVLAVLIGAMILGGILALWCFHSIDATKGVSPLADLDRIRKVSYSCWGGSVAQQSFSYSLERQDEKVLFSCEYFRVDQDGSSWEKVAVEDAEIPAEAFTELIQHIAKIEFPNEREKKDDDITALDADSYSLIVYDASGESRSLTSHVSIKEIQEFFRNAAAN